MAHASPDHLAAVTLGRSIVAKLDTAIEQATAANAPWVVEQARHFRAKYAGWLNSDYDLGDMLGMFGPNGWQPGAEDVCRSAEFFAREAAETLALLTDQNAGAAEHRVSLAGNLARAKLCNRKAAA